jgi:protein gp37
MGTTSIIEWTDSTLNFWRGCDKVDPTCAECYMFRDQRRYGLDPTVVVRCSPTTFYAPLKSRKWREKRDRCIAERGQHLVFVSSWSDFFHEKADPWRIDAWDVIRQTPESTYQILTSRPERIHECLPPDWGAGWPHVWMGATIGNRKFVHRADMLRAVPAAARFISAEPLLGPLVAPMLDVEVCEIDDRVYPVAQARGTVDRTWVESRRDWSHGDDLDLTDIDWLIVGGESGGRPGRRLVDEHNQPREERLGWVRDLRDACLAQNWRCECGDLNRYHETFCYRCGAGQPEPGAPGARTACFFKQWGGPRPTSGGRLLDGRTWDEIPSRAACIARAAARR